MILGRFPAYYMFNGLLILLQILHYFWFYLICQVAITAFKAGKVNARACVCQRRWILSIVCLFSLSRLQVRKDERSDSDETDDEQTGASASAKKDK